MTHNYAKTRSYFLFLVAVTFNISHKRFIINVLQ